MRCVCVQFAPRLVPRLPLPLALRLAGLLSLAAPCPELPASRLGRGACLQSAKASPLNTASAKARVKAELAAVLDKDFIRDHARMMRWSPAARL